MSTEQPEVVTYQAPPVHAQAFVVQLLRDAPPNAHPVRIFAQPIAVINFKETQ